MTAPPEVASRVSPRLVLLLGAVIGLGPLTIDMYLPAFPAMVGDLRATAAGVQLTLTGMLVGLAAGQLVVGPMSDALGRRRPLLAGLAAHAAASVLAALAPDVVTLTGVRVLQGVAGAAVSVCVLASVRDRFAGAAMARLMSRLMLVIGVAPILAPSLGGIILDWTSWRGIFVVLAAAALLLLGTAALAVRETLPPGRRRSARPVATLATYRSLLRDRTFMALVFVAGLTMSALFAYVSGSSFVLQEVYGLDERAFGLAFGANSVGLVLFTQLNPLLLRRLHPAQVLTGAVTLGVTAAAALLAVAVSGWGGLPALLPPLWLVVASCGLALPNTPALALSRHGEAAGTAAALLGSVQFGVGAAVAPLVGALGSGSAVPMAAVILAVLSLALLLLLTVVRRR